ncbi:AAA family ATPase [Delftia sp. Lp-1]|uniref:AAA family ATPase n=1 Tax=Delftia sp. Lp-1 TaxID=682863 RepID=UPI001E574F9B|nr:AAA family ATPase [Delftia sp. Lp-1]MCB4787049.1 AAA family ATPase [Delftia sp. Lp-1]
MTKLVSMDIIKFRGLNNINIDLANQVTLICGKNGTSKSSLLGIAAQIFSFEKDYQSGDDLGFETITGFPFKSLPSEHFRFSDKFDGPNSMAVNFKIFDAYSEEEYESSLELTTRSTATGAKKARPVVRGNTSSQNTENTSRNYTHPVIFLSLKRLMPITMRRAYTPGNYDYLQDNMAKFIALNNELLNKNSTVATGTIGTIKSAVAFGENYDQDSVSVGEDNAGQISLALMSFRKLRDEYPGYRGGLLLIDEADAGLFPAAQIKLIDMLHRECNDLGIQVILTSHSPSMIEHVHNLGQKYQRNFKTIYLTDTYGAISSRPDMTWQQIDADIHTKTIALRNDVSLPQVNVYFEDQEAVDFFDILMMRHPAKKILKTINVSLGCDNYIQLIKAKIPEFAVNSLIVLDADAKEKSSAYSTIIALPGDLPPDQLIFEFLYNIDASFGIWKNEIQYTRKNFTSSASAIISTLGISTNQIKLKDHLKSYGKPSSEKKITLRKVFKDFYKSKDFQAFLKLKHKDVHPWKVWASFHQQDVEDFRNAVSQKVAQILKKSYGIGGERTDFLNIKN